MATHYSGCSGCGDGGGWPLMLLGHNGYPSRRRSLVDDARFESLVVKQNKQTVLEEARQKTNDEATLEECIQQAKGAPIEQEIVLQADQSIENVEMPAEVQEILEESHNETVNASLGAAAQGEGSNNDSNNANDAGLTEEEVLLANAAAESTEAENAMQSAALIVRLKEGISSLGRILKAIETFKGAVQHVESRVSREQGVDHDVLIKVDMTRGNLLQLVRSLRQSGSFNSISLLAEHNISVKAPWFPKHASELDNCNHLMTKYEPDLDMNHPGFADKVYRQRRKEIAEIAFAYKYGDPIPYIEYTDVEVKTWRSVLLTVIDLAKKHACQEYRAAFQMLRDEEIFVEHRLPQLQEMSDFLRRNTGFTLRPAAGLLTARDFLASLAFRIFQSTQYVRHVNSPFHTPEPDCIHELLGHMPLLADPSFAQFSQEIGLASLGASDEEIEKLSTVYWFTVEFGLCKEHGQVKAYGAGLLSSYGELLHAISD
ncbi:PREDICTED: tyrosine 3-monooxygenase, partial [Rhagoletis zephyria]|uniref:tyrosine 3-monooxygenase n=1 Tax=Rhagoletis zephyria TaxID=28612 RepID=UPI000811335D